MTNYRLVFSVFVFLFSVTVQSQEILYTFEGDEAYAHFGRSVSGAGDVNRDGFDDVMVASLPSSGNGKVQVFSGADGKILYTFYGKKSEDHFGQSISSAGDVNRDGYPDIIVGAVVYDPPGRMYTGVSRIYSGKNGKPLRTFKSKGKPSFAWSVSGAGDVNHDGFDDVMVSDPNADSPTQSGTGLVQVFSGKNGKALYTFYGDNEGDNFGGSVSAAGDVNGDGYADMIVSASYKNNNETIASGQVRVFSGKDGSVLYTFNGSFDCDYFGSAVSGAGDINNDGYADIVVGVPYSGADDIGNVKVFSGVDGSILYTFNGSFSYDYFGLSVSGAGDVNADGYPDIIVGDLGRSHGFASGDARILSGKDGAVLSDLHGEYVQGYFGISVSGAGDVNHDGYADVIVGAGFIDNQNLMGTGRAQIFSGR